MHFSLLLLQVIINYDGFEVVYNLLVYSNY